MLLKSLCGSTGSFAPLFTIRCGQPDADSAFINLDPKAAVLVIIGLLAQFWELGGMGQQPFFQLGIVGVDLCGGVFSIVIYLSDFA